MIGNDATNTTEKAQRDAAVAAAIARFRYSQIPYVKQVDVQGQRAYVVCSGDGTELGALNDRELAFVAARQHDLDPVSVH